MTCIHQLFSSVMYSTYVPTLSTSLLLLAFDVTKQLILSVWKLKDNSPTSTETGLVSSSTYTVVAMMVI